MTIIKKLPLAIWLILALSLALHIGFTVTQLGQNFEPPPEELKKTDPELYELTIHTSTYGSRDAYLYAKLARQFLEHGVYGYDALHTGEIVQNAVVSPGEPIYLIVLFFIADLFSVNDLAFVKAANILLSVGSTLLLYLISRRLFNSLRIGIFSTLLYATYFSPLHFVQTTLTEIPGIFFYLLAFYLYLLAYQANRNVHHVLFALVFCYAVMIRPTLAPIILFAFLLILLKYRIKGSFRIGLLWLAGPLVVVFPWVLRNYLLLNEFVLFSTNEGNSWFAGANPFFLISGSERYGEMYALGMNQKEYAIMKIKEGFATQFNLWFSWFTVGKTYELFKVADAVYFYEYEWTRLFKWQHKIVVGLGFLTAFLVREKKTLAVTAIFLTYLSLSNLFLPIPRYGFYIIPILCLLGGVGLSRFLDAAFRIFSALKSKRQGGQAPVV